MTSLERRPYYCCQNKSYLVACFTFYFANKRCISLDTLLHISRNCHYLTDMGRSRSRSRSSTRHKRKGKHKKRRSRSASRNRSHSRRNSPNKHRSRSRDRYSKSSKRRYDIFGSPNTTCINKCVRRSLGVHRRGVGSF